MKAKSAFRIAFPLAAAIAALLAFSFVRAGQIWDGTGGDNNWNTAANWNGDILPTFTNAITFVGNTRNGAINNLTADTIIGGINLTSDGTSGKTNAFTLSGNRITLGGNIVTTASSSAITDTISLNMILNADRTITTNTNHNLTVSGIISQSGTRRLTKDGAGILTLSNANSYSGGTTINSGTLNVANVSGLGATGSMVSLGASSTLRLSTDTAFGSGGNPVYNVEMKNPGPYTSTIELNRATAGAYTGITHNFGLLEISLNGGTAATLNVTAGANASGALDTIAFTSMRAGNNNTVTETLNPTGGNITIGTLKAFGTHLVTMALSGTTAGNAITGVIGGTGNEQLVAISKIGNSTWTLSNAGNNFTGGTTFSGGTLVFANGALGTTGAITASGGTLRWASSNTQDISSRLAMTAATSTFDTNGNNVTFASAIGSSVAAALTKTGSGALTLQGTNTYTGATTVNAGTLTLDYATNNTTKLSNTTALVLGGGTVNLAGATGSHVEVVASTTLTAGTASYVTRTGLSTAILQLGTITNNTGTLNIGGAGIATANNSHTAGTILGTWATIGGDWAITAASGTNIPITAYTGYTDVNRFAGSIATGSTTNVRIIEAGSSGNITMAAGTTSINTLNQSISGGTSAATIDAASRILQTNGILMGPTAGALTIGTSAGSGTLSSTAATGSIIVTNNSANTLTINSVIANNTTTSLVKTGTGVLVLNGLSTYTGGTTLQDGTLRVGATVGSSSTNGILGSVFNNGITIADKPTAVFDLNGNTAYIKDLMGGGSLGGNVTLGSGTLVLTNVSNNANRYNGTISGTGNLTVNGSSSWNTAGAHTYTGISTANSALWITTILADGGIASGIGQSSSDAGNLVINNGSLSYRGTSAASTNRQFTLAGNGGLAVDDVGAITWSYTGAVTYSGAGTKTLNLTRSGTGLGTLAASIGDNTIGGSAAISINKTGSSNWALTNAGSAFTGTITFNVATGNSGSLAYASAGGANAITFSQTTGTATLSYIGSTDKTMSGAITANALSSGTITLDASGTGAVNYSNTGSLGAGGASGAKGLVLSGTNTGDNILAGQWVNNTLGGLATLTKNGAGTWVLTNNNGYTGATAVNAGTLLVNGNQSTANGAVTVNGGTLGGSGTIGGSVTVATNGSLAPGASAGTLNIGGGLTVAAMATGTSGKLKFELGADTANSDQLAVAGTLTIGSGVLGFSDFNFSNLVGGPQNVTYTLITSGGINPGDTLDASNLSGPIGVGGTGTLAISGNNIVLNVTGLAGGSAYDTWAINDEPFDGDANGDGVKDGLAFLLGAANPSENAIGRLPTVTQSGGNLILNFNCLPTAARGTATLKVAHSTNLGSWTATTDEVPDANDPNPDNNVTFEVGAGPEGPPALNSVTATISSAAAAGGGKLFGRLEATQP